MMAVARAMSEMMKKGWRPRRSILFVSWDGEEQGLLGSTEFVEDLTAELKAKTAIYVNRDAGAGGLNFSGSAVHSLTPFVYELAQSIQPEGTTKNLYDGWLERSREAAPAGAGQPMLKTPPVGALGSGSDYTAFLDHAGIASLDMGLSGRGGDGSYHSTYDNPTWFKKYIDPQFKFSRARRADHRRRAAAARRRGAAAVRLRGLRPADPGVRRRDRTAGDQAVARRRQDDRLRRAARGRRGVREGGAPTCAPAATRCSPRRQVQVRLRARRISRRSTIG